MPESLAVLELLRLHFVTAEVVSGVSCPGGSEPPSARVGEFWSTRSSDPCRTDPARRQGGEHLASLLQDWPCRPGVPGGDNRPSKDSPGAACRVPGAVPGAPGGQESGMSAWPRLHSICDVFAAAESGAYRTWVLITCRFCLLISPRCLGSWGRRGRLVPGGNSLETHSRVCPNDPFSGCLKAGAKGHSPFLPSAGEPPAPSPSAGGGSWAGRGASKGHISLVGIR